MACNCKASSGSSSNTEPTSGIHTFLKYSAKIIGFLIGVLLLPLMVVGIIWFMFDIIVLNKDVDLSILLKKIVKVNQALFAEDEDEEDDEDYDDEDIETEYITENVEEIK